jgi:hypothetical protein
MCEMSRQASNTESAENPEVAFSVLDELVKLSGNDDNLSDKSEDTLARSNSDSTERAQSEGDNCSHVVLSILSSSHTLPFTENTFSVLGKSGNFISLDLVIEMDISEGF